MAIKKSNLIGKHVIVRSNPNKKKILQYDLNMKLIKKYNSITEAAKQLNTNQSSISRVLLGFRKQNNGFIFKYV